MNDAMNPCAEARRPQQPAWMLLALGGLFATIVLSALSTPRGGPATGNGRPFDLQTACPRELRGLPGIGPTRAAAIAEYRWRMAGAAFELREIPGIGLTTQRRVLEWLEQAHP